MYNMTFTNNNYINKYTEYDFKMIKLPLLQWVINTSSKTFYSTLLSIINDILTYLIM